MRVDLALETLTFWATLINPFDPGALLIINFIQLRSNFSHLSVISVLNCPRNPFEESQPSSIKCLYTTFKMSARLIATWIPHAFPN